MFVHEEEMRIFLVSVRLRPPSAESTYHDSENYLSNLKWSDPGMCETNDFKGETL